MDTSLRNPHVKLLAFDLLSLTQTPSFSRRGIELSRAEVLGVVTSREHKHDKLLSFTIDDGTGCVPCVLWLNQLHSPKSPYFSRLDPVGVRLIAAAAKHFASLIEIGFVARVRGRITKYKGSVQITVSDAVAERDPNVEIMHWLDCVRLARKCYDVAPQCRKPM